MGITQIVNENAVKCKRTVFNPLDVGIPLQFMLRAERGVFNGQDAIRELEMLLANLICVHTKSTRD